MRNVLIVFLIIIILMYVFSGRYLVTQRNIQERGMGALMDEPIWICEAIGQAIHATSQLIHRFIKQEQNSAKRY